VGPYPEDASYFRKLGAVVREDVHRVLSEHPSARVTIACGGFELLGIAPWLPIETHDRLTVTCDDPLDVLKRTELLFTNKMSTLVVDALREGVPVRCFRETDPIWERLTVWDRLTEDRGRGRVLWETLSKVLHERRHRTVPSSRSVFESECMVRLNSARVAAFAWRFRAPVRDVFVFDDAAQCRFVTEAVERELPWPRAARITEHTLLVTLCKENDLHRRLTERRASGWIAIDACPMDRSAYASVRYGTEIAAVCAAVDAAADDTDDSKREEDPAFEGKILMVMDNPLGMHWSSPRRHADHWAGITQLVSASGFEPVVVPHPNHQKPVWSDTYSNSAPSRANVRPLDNAATEHPDAVICVCGRGSSAIRCIRRGFAVVDGSRTEEVRRFVRDPKRFLEQNKRAMLEALTECVVSRSELANRIRELVGKHAS
jgi:hypothetical protein